MAFNPFFGGRLEAALRAGEAATGQRRSIVSAERTPEEQAQLYADYSRRTFQYNGVTYGPRATGGLAAKPPGFEGAVGSRHQIGEAVDLGPGAVRNWVMANASQFGLEGLGARDPNHIQLARGISRTQYDPAGQGYTPNPIYRGSDLAQTVAPTPGFVLPANAPAGMGNNNPLNIKYYAGSPYNGVLGPSANTDQGDPQMKFATPQHGWDAAYQLLMKKYSSGRLSANDIIAAQGGWTPGNFTAAGNVARSAGLSPTEDIHFSDPARAKAFMKALVTQEQGAAGSAYPDAMIEEAIKTGGHSGGGSATDVPSEIARLGILPKGAVARGSAPTRPELLSPSGGSGGGETQPPPDTPDLASVFSEIGSALGGGGGGGSSGGLAYDAADYSPAPNVDLQASPAAIPAETLEMPWTTSVQSRQLGPLAQLFSLKTIGQPASKLAAMQAGQTMMPPSIF